MVGIYLFKNIINGKVYIGSSKNIYRRKNEHLKKLSKNCHHCKGLQNAWNKYGENNFSFEILETLQEYDKTILLIREEFFINKVLNENRKNLYNSKLKPTCNFKPFFTEELRSKQSQRMLGNKIMVGLKRSKESIEKQRLTFLKILKTKTKEQKTLSAKKAVITRNTLYDFGELISKGKKLHAKFDWDNKQTKPVKQLDLEGNLIKLWASAYQVEKTFGWKSSNVSRICYGGVGLKTYKGFKWEFFK